MRDKNEIRKIPVYLIKGNDNLISFVPKILNPLLPASLLNKTVLVKPNLLKGKDILAVTSPWIILECVKLLKEKGAKVIVADSPAFGTAERVIKQLGIYHQLTKLGAKVCTLRRPKKVKINAINSTVGISELALKSDLIVNLPRLKAHCQMGITCGVKNLYGTVVGFRKPLYHMLYGKDRETFSKLIIEISQKLPSCITLVDGSVAMHKKGPTGGEAIKIGLLASSDNPFAVDTAIYEILGARPNEIPLFAQGIKLNIPGTTLDELYFPIMHPKDIHLNPPFIIPTVLDPITFSPLRFLKGRIKSVIRKIN